MTFLMASPSEQKRLSIFGLAAILFLFFPGCDASKTLTKERIKTAENGLLKSIVFEGEKPERMKLTDRMAYYKVPGVSISVIDNFQIEWAKGYGFTKLDGQDPVTIFSIFQAASISQAVTAAGALTLVARDDIGLDVNINDYLQSWTLPENQLTQKDKVTLRRLLSRNSGLVPLEYEGVESIKNKPSLLQILNGDKTDNPPVYVSSTPGTELEYSEAGFAIIEKLIEEKSGQFFAEFMARVVLTPFQMERSSFADILPDQMFIDAVFGHNRDGFPFERKGHIYPVTAANGLWTTPSDLAVFTIELMSAALGHAQSVFEDYYLIIQPTGQKATRFFVENPTTFFSTDPYIRIRFARDAEGTVTGLVLRQRDFRLEAKKIE